MYPLRRAVVLVAVAGLIAACAATDEKQPAGESKFYKNLHVRQCLQFEKEQLITESRACWTQLLRRVEAEPDFREEQELTDSDVSRIRSRAQSSDQRSAMRKRAWDDCLNLASHQRTERLSCFRQYLARHGDSMTRAERFEVENSIADLEAAREQAAGNLEATIEHAGKLLGAGLFEDEEGIRIDVLTAGGPLAQAAAPEQGLIVALDDTLVMGLTSAERIARLEACEEQPLRLLVRHGGLTEVSFTDIEARCGPAGRGQRLSHRALPPETCTGGADSAELAAGLSWCYHPHEGQLEVDEVCADSPAAAAGARPGQLYVSVNGQRLLGRSYEEIAGLVKGFPAVPLELTERGGALASPPPISGPALEQAKRVECWKAIEATLEKGPE